MGRKYINIPYTFVNNGSVLSGAAAEISEGPELNKKVLWLSLRKKLMKSFFAVNMTKGGQPIMINVPNTAKKYLFIFHIFHISYSYFFTFLNIFQGIKLSKTLLVSPLHFFFSKKKSRIKNSHFRYILQLNCTKRMHWCNWVKMFVNN